MQETLVKVNELLKKFNSTFKIGAHVINEGGEEVANGLKIESVKNEGTEFVSELFEVLNTIVSSVSDEHELVYNNDRGLVIARKVVTVDYIIED